VVRHRARDVEGPRALEGAAFARDAARRGEGLQPVTPLSVGIETLDLLVGWSAQSVLGWTTPGGPIALPARWGQRAERVRVPAGPLRDAGGPRSAAACVCVDESEGLGPLAKRGTLFRRQGRARLRGDMASVALQVERVTRWKGFQTQTSPARS
jgi:hypothetical protein